MYLKEDNLNILNGSLFTVDLTKLSKENLKIILKACGLKSSTNSLNNQIKMIEDIKKYLITGDILNLNNPLGNNSKLSELNNYSIKYEDMITYELIIKSIRNNPILLENIMINQSIRIYEIVECCSKYLNIPINLIENEIIYNKIKEILTLYNVLILNE